MEDPKQQAVIKNRSKGNLLVSASAGAGKTKVLVDRVVHELITDPQLGIDNLLIVTFTRAAAKQMKDRIRRQLQKSITSKLFPNRDRILQQIEDLPNAKIGTLDAFCQQVVERYYYVIGLDPHFRILNNSSEVILLRDQVWKNVREDLYDEDSDAFKRLALNFFNRHINADDQLTDPLTNLIYKLYDSFQIAPNQQRWLNNLQRVYTVTPTLKQSYLYKNVLNHQLKIQLSQIGVAFKHGDQVAKQMQMDKEYNVIDPENKLIWQMLKHLAPSQGSWNELRAEALKIAQELRHRFPTSPRKASVTIKQAHNEVKDARNAGKKAFNKMIDNFFIFDEKGNQKIIEQTSQIIDELLRVVQRFAKAYAKEKQKRHVLEFIDIERAALRILQESSAVRTQLQNSIHEIMIDEYQDDNRLQDTILGLVAKHNPKTGEPTNVFMVGDVKQSIYRFRSADPTLFIKKDDAYRKANPNGNQEITLSRNYRSTVNVDRFVNLIFKQIMNKQFGKVDYSKEPEKFGAKDAYAGSKNNVKVPVNVMIYDQPKDHRPDNDSDTVKNSTDGQIKMVAQEIRRLVNDPEATVYDSHLGHERPIDYRDIALIASTRDDNVAISDVFRRYQIPVQMLGSQNYFKTTEIQIMLSLLEIIDNPDQDIPLVAVLRSPMVGLDENQLAYLRINSKTGNYFRAVKKFSRDYPSNGYPESAIGDRIHPTIQKFLKDLKRYRKITQRHGLVDLIWNIYQTTGFLDYVSGMPAGTQRQANLHAFYERAADYEQANFHGLFHFIRFIHQLQNQQKDLTEAAPQQSKNMVTSVTIHGSKGLEFPVVFLLDASRTFNQGDLRNDFILNHRFGLGIKYFDPKLHSQLNTLPYQGIMNDEKENDLAEEMRKLYVALTRAQQRLYVIGKATKMSRRDKSPRDALLKKWSSFAQSPRVILNLTDRVKAKNYLDWIGASLVRLPAFKKRYLDVNSVKSPQGLVNDKTNFKLTFENDQQIIQNQSKFAPDSTINVVSNKLTDDEKRAIKEVMTFRYPHLAATKEGNYRSVSDVKQLFEDPNSVEMGELDQENHRDYHGLSNQFVTGNFTTPQFIQKAHQPKSTEIGTATHLVLQMIDLHQRPTLELIDDTIKRLVADQMIDPGVAKKISRYNIRSFFYSPYGENVLNHPDDYHRETPFSLLVSAHQILPHEFNRNAPERILIHGIIDGYLYYDHQASIVDYKTDFVNFKDKAASVKKIVKRYRGQLNLYGMALSSVIGHPVKHKYLYLLSSHQLIEIK